MEKRFEGAFEGAANNRNFLLILWILNIDVIGEHYWQARDETTLSQMATNWPPQLSANLITSNVVGFFGSLK